MIDQNRYFITNDTKLATCLRACGVGNFLQVDEEKSTLATVYFVFSPLRECSDFAQKFYLGQVLVEPTSYEAAKSYIHSAIKTYREETLLK